MGQQIQGIQQYLEALTEEIRKLVADDKKSPHGRDVFGAARAGGEMQADARNERGKALLPI